MNKNTEKKTTEVQPIDMSALKLALNVRSNVRAGILSVVGKAPSPGQPPLCLACGRGL
jgi:hypothetical protein